MAGPYEWIVGTRYLRATHGRGFLSFISLVSVLGLAIGVAVLIVVLSVMNGFERELKTRILSVTSHATLMGLDGVLKDWRGDQAQALKMPGVLAAAPYIEAQALLMHGEHTAGTAVRGVQPEQERRAVGLAERIQGGRVEDLLDGSYRIILGDALAESLAAHVGDDVVLIAPKGDATPAGIEPRMRRFRVAGTFHSGMYEYDRALALLNLADAARIYQLGDRVSGLRLALSDPFMAPRLVRDLALSRGGGYYVSDWTRNHANFFRSIEITKSMLFVILLLLVAVAAFNLVATLVMVVKEKRGDIAILRTIGAAPRSVLAIFTIQGTFIGFTGTAAGAALGLILSANLEALVHALERVLGTHFLDAKVYFMSDLPAYAEWGDVLRICGVAFALCAVATLYPAWRAAGTQPAEALRHD
ncbi:MAG TPA: lipoprotein-releasing ABC transporter permease subunit [Steroidobacteraceae bacterium]|jgi:lipoprotein-releasing system permease protein|nr:lipoprotein-releasing ABC transporter permease subunit [Steroidobacteraceae bacterium]